MAKLVLVDIKNGIGTELKFTLGRNSIPKTDWPVYVFDRLITEVKDKIELWNIFLKANMVPNYLINENIDRIEFRLYDDRKDIGIVFNNALLKEQAIDLINQKSNSLSFDKHYYPEFLAKFIEQILDYDARKYLKENYGEESFLYNICMKYAYSTGGERECALEKINDFFQNYLNLREFRNINEKMEKYRNKCHQEREEALEIRKKIELSLKRKQEVSETVTTIDQPPYIKQEPVKKEDSIRCLCLVVDSQIEPLILLENTSTLLDDIIISQFKSSSEIRKKYKQEIEYYLEKNKTTLEQIRKKLNKPNYAGQIVILEKNSLGLFSKRNDGQYKKISVLYSSIWNEVKNLTLNIRKMSELLRLNSYNQVKTPVFSQFESSKLKAALRKKQNNIKTPYEIECKNWIKSLKNSSNKYEQLRNLKYYLANGKLKVETVDEMDQLLDEKKDLNQEERFYDVQVYGDYEEFLDEEEINQAYSYNRPYVPGVKKW